MIPQRIDATRVEPRTLLGLGSVALAVGASVEGIVCNVPPQSGSRCKQLVFPLKLSKNGCSANKVTINAVEYRAARLSLL